MSLASLVAPLAGIVAAVAIVEMAASRRPRLRAPRALPAGVVAALARIGRRVGAPAPARGLDERIAAAGSPLGLGVPDVMAVKGGSAVVLLLSGLPLATTLPGRLPVVATPALPMLGYFLPDLILSLRARARGRAMALELPDLLDLLRVSLGAGLPVPRAMAEVARRHRGLLASEWRVTAAELTLGLPRQDAMRALARRCPIPGMTALVTAVERAERHGVPLADTLAAQAGEARTARARRMQERAARAAPKIQLVIALLLVPSVLLLVAAALVASLMR